MNKLIKDIKNNLIVIIFIIIYFALTKIIFGYSCIFRILFHIECPGCGLTRALKSLLKGDITKAMHYNYSIIFWLILLIIFIINRYIKPLKVNVLVLFIITVLITLIRYILIVFFLLFGIIIIK